jgi:hypothetical protein
LSWILEPSPSLRRIVFDDLPRRCPLAGKRIRVLGRRPLVFYLLLAGANLQLEEDLESIKRDLRPADCLLLDRVLVAAGSSPEEIEGRMGSAWKRDIMFEDRLDAVTLLDHDPSAATLEPHRRSNANEILLMTPRSQDLPRDDPPPSSQQLGRTHEP